VVILLLVQQSQDILQVLQLSVFKGNSMYVAENHDTGEKSMKHFMYMRTVSLTNIHRC